MFIKFFDRILWYPADAAAAAADAVKPVDTAADTKPVVDTTAKPADAKPVDTAAKPADTKPADTAAADSKPTPSLLAKEPEVVLFDSKNVKLPEGFTLSEADMKTFSEFASANKLSHENGEKLLAMHAGVVRATNEAAANHYRSTREGWVKEVKADKEIGGSQFENVRSTISKALDQYGDPGLRAMLDMTGAGDHPALIRTMYRMAKALTENTKTPPAGVPASGQKKSGAQIMYPNMEPNA